MLEGWPNNAESPPGRGSSSWRDAWLLLLSGVTGPSAVGIVCRGRGAAIGGREGGGPSVWGGGGGPPRDGI